MRIHIPASAQANPVGYMVQNFRPVLGAAHMNFSRATYQSKLTLREFEAARNRTAAINGCIICQAMRASRGSGEEWLRALGDANVQTVLDRGPVPDEAFYAAVAEWRESPVFSDRERIAIEYADKLGLDPHGLARDEDFWRRFKSLYRDDEIVDLSHCIACFMGLGRIAHALGVDNVCHSGVELQEEQAVGQPD
jgi:alkylhydroperoxidase family enzyme